MTHSRRYTAMISAAPFIDIPLKRISLCLPKHVPTISGKSSGLSHLCGCFSGSISVSRAAGRITLSSWTLNGRFPSH